MKKVLLIIFSGLLLLGGCGGQESVLDGDNSEIEERDSMPEITSQLKISSPTFEHEGAIPSKYTCDGDNVSLPLTFSEVPEGTKSLVLISDDPDAPNGDWVHWLVWNIKPQITEIAENSVPEKAVEGKTSFGSTGYGGPCPPSGKHRYFFKFYALDAILDLGPSAGKGELLEAMDGHVVGEAELVGTYERN
ncbi:YbhB/YbcL family Raf kinase inhibitor-like protein [Candidatus Falkowbacteria bacterium]|nr:YbhB/YbcL family Raf kinase inhibitor-like protein [Candidatus Falkowbacteria bacterium]